MSNANDRLVSVVTWEMASRRFRQFAMEPSLNPLLECWWKRLAARIERGEGASSTLLWEQGRLLDDVVVEELVAAYHEVSPQIGFPINIGTTFPPLIAAVVANDDEVVAVQAALKRWKS